ncbi:hypothetical protein [Granulosicoccus antarcticus]|uniref:Uncharacterized protein n=1 Tax=Granulosicoccus antarcticus IMCC3135 TaxID=1192854 RepID=A0A2Z2NH61_9GAMM|nr:hypothetical protein [Granulosicoccus antarcticus]ASJ70469.1 hypothetical protein IMCC3135_01750 [Granulosicoccus antarcticus IMCC3135]
MSKKVKKKPYDWPPPLEPDVTYVPKQRNPIHSILTALPVIMLIVGLYIHFQSESEQSHSAPIRAESMDAEGVFTGLSVVKSGSTGRHYLWFEEAGKARGARVQPSQAQALESLVRGEMIQLSMAPSVSGSNTHWVWHVEQDGVVFLDLSEQLQ